jgi:hypothetical protein
LTQYLFGGTAKISSTDACRPYRIFFEPFFRERLGEALRHGRNVKSLFERLLRKEVDGFEALFDAEQGSVDENLFGGDRTPAGASRVWHNQRVPASLRRRRSS